MGLFTFMLAAGPVLAQPHEGDIIVGRTDAGQLKVEFDFAPLLPLPAVSGPINGFSDSEPGFDHLEANEPAEDFYVLAPGAEVYFEIVSFEDAFQVWGAGFSSGPHLNPGEHVLLGDELLHSHVIWHVNSDDPAYDPLDSPWDATFRLVDLGTTGYAPSEAYTARFVPEPSTAALLGVALVGVLRRRRR